MVLLPDVGVYIIEVCAVSEGGDGTASPQIRVPSFSGKVTLIFGIVVVIPMLINSIILYLKKFLTIVYLLDKIINQRLPFYAETKVSSDI